MSDLVKFRPPEYDQERPLSLSGRARCPEDCKFEQPAILRILRGRLLKIGIDTLNNLRPTGVVPESHQY